ncbi:unnamed protein product [marine sediment metagenome]|uniref:Uncharacterized protein n=1 Tax=marine sediment metagenome TaxID=412755 RepID=X1D596_9ZZZZ
MFNNILWNVMNIEGNHEMELFEEEVEIYNSKMRLLNWLYDEIRIHPELFKDMVNKEGQKLPLNL